MSVLREGIAMRGFSVFVIFAVFLGISVLVISLASQVISCNADDPKCFTFVTSDMMFSDRINISCINGTQRQMNMFLNNDGVYTEVCDINDRSRFDTYVINWTDVSKAQPSSEHLITRTDLDFNCEWESRDFGASWELGQNTNPFNRQRCDEDYRLNGTYPNGQDIPDSVVTSEVRMYNYGS